MNTSPAPILFIQIRRKRYQIDSLEQASQMVCKARDALMLRVAGGCSNFKSPLIVDENGAVFGYVAYNGRVFEGDPRSWTSATRILFDNREGVAR